MTTQGKSLNQKSFAMASQGAGLPDIDMPPLGEVTPIQSSAPDPWGNQQTQVQQPNHPDMFQVPTELPTDVREEMASQNANNQENTQYQPDNTAPQQPQYQEQPQDNFANLRMQKAKAERERDALLSQMLEMQKNSMKQQAQPEQPKYQEEEFNIDDDSLVEGKVVKKMFQQQQQKTNQLEAQMRAAAAKNQAAIVETQLKSQYPDLAQVLSEQNIAALAEQYPELARSLNDTQDYYDKVSSVYRVIKQFGIYRNPVNEQERARIQSNSQKPRPLASVNPQQGDSPLSRANAFANGMTDELKKQLQQEMYNARKAL